MKAKALTSFYSKEHGAVSIGDQMNFQDSATMQEYVNAGYVEEMSDDMAVPSQAEMNAQATEAPKASKASRKAKATAQDTEFSQELGAMQPQATANAQASKTASKTSNKATAQDTEFSQELGATTNAQNVAEAQAHEAQVAQKANEMNDMNENNK